MQHDMNIDAQVSLTEVLTLPGAVEPSDPKISVDDLTEVAAKALKQALNHLVDARKAEGSHLKEDLCARKDTLLKNVEELTSRSKGTENQLKEKILNRIKESGLDLELDNDRLHQEVVFYADRADVTEELVRLDGHLKQFEKLLEKTDPVGRELDFLMQEMNREVNTCASKSSDSEMARLVVALKAELERCREQIQNVE